MYGGTLSIKSFGISAYIWNRIFSKNVNNFENLQEIFPLFQQVSLIALRF